MLWSAAAMHLSRFAALILPALCLTRSAALGSESDCYSATSAATRYDSKAVFGNHGDQEQRDAKYCEPPFENLAVNRQVVASSTCGSPPIRVCSRRGFCDLCDSEQRKLSYSASHLTDYHVHSTCWISGRVSPDDSGVNLTLSLGKKHTVYYVSLTDCGLGLPDAIEAYKSADFGVSWQLWHLFSNNCSADYPGHRAGYSYDFGVYINPREVVCSDTSQVDPAVPGSANSDTDKFDSSPHSDENRRSNSMDRIVLSFSTNFKRYRPQEDRDRDPIIADWMLATDIRLLLRRKQRRQQSPLSDWRSRRRDFPAVAVGDAFALSNIDVGGRCFCNGHAARCLPSSKAGGPGASVCDCQHGTEGEDCERCKPFWVDLPWRRGTQEQPTQCRRCQCNGHTDRCHFDASTYQFSAQPKSAGVCLGCRHNTAGRNCQYCRPGYHRNWLAAVDSVRVCTLCNCHPLGSTSGICDRDTGRCVCKSGVGGEKCDRCLAGFEQTSDPAAPCRRPQDKVKDVDRSASPKTETDSAESASATERTKTSDGEDVDEKSAVRSSKHKKCPTKCASNSRRLSRANYRNVDWAVAFLVQRVAFERRWVRVVGTVQLTIRCSIPTEPSDRNLIGSCDSPAGSTTTELYIRRRHWDCSCPPQLQPGLPYLVLRRLPKRERRQRLARRRRRRRRRQSMLLRRDIVWPWTVQLQERLQRLEATGGRGRRRQRRRQKRRDNRSGRD